MYGNDVAVGVVTGTGAALNVSIGFKPRYVKVFCDNDAGTTDPTIEWWEGMAAGSGLKGMSIADNGTTGNKSQDKITSNGISQYAGSEAANSEGFTLGADTHLNVSGKPIYYIAVR